MFKVIAVLKGWESDFGDCWRRGLYVEFTPDTPEEAIFYAHNAAECARGQEMYGNALLNDLADFAGFYRYYGGVGRSFSSGAYFRFHKNRDRVLLEQSGGLDV